MKPEDLTSGTHFTKDVDGTIDCSAGTFGSGAEGGNKKQCVCVKSSLPDAPTAALCAKDGGKCACGGNVFYGSSASGDFKSIFEDQDATYALKTSSGSIDCNATVFGDPAPKSKNKACFCQESEPFKPAEGMLVEKCAEEDGKCACFGKVHYGVAAGSGSAPGFSSAPISKDLRKTGKGSIDCTTAEFGDPAIGKKKQCFCERPKPPSPLPKATKCGDEGELCKCNGQVYMGR